MGVRHLYFNFDDPRLLVLISGYPRFLTTFFCMTFRFEGQGHGGNDLKWVGARHLYSNFNNPRLSVLIFGYPRFLTSFFCMTLISQCQCHGGNNLKWVGARHLYLNFDDPRLLVRETGARNKYLTLWTSLFDSHTQYSHPSKRKHEPNAFLMLVQQHCVDLSCFLTGI